MDNNLYYILGGIAYGIFILQFIISWVAGEFDVDVDFDGDSNTAGQFMANMAKNLAPSLEIARNLPIADSLKQIITGKKPEESPAKGDNFPPVK